MSSTFKPVVLILPERRSGNSSCGRPVVVNGLTFDLSAPSRIIRINPSSANNQTTPSCDDIAASIPESVIQFQSETSSTLQSANKTFTTCSDNGVIRHESSSPSSAGNMSKVTLCPPNACPPPSEGKGSVGVKSASHKEVERRRKLKISTCIQQLSDCLPFKIFGKVSHGDVLEKVIEYIQNLESENDDLNSKVSSPVAQVRSIYANLFLEHIMLKELKAILKGENTATAHGGTEESRDSMRQSIDTTEKSHDIQEESQEKQGAGFISDACDSPKVVDKASLLMSATPTSTRPFSVQQQRSVVYQSWPVVSLLSDTHSSSSNSVVSSISLCIAPSSPSQTSGSQVASTSVPFSHSSSALCSSYVVCATNSCTQPVQSSIQTSRSSLTRHSSSGSSAHFPHRSTVTAHTHIVQPWVDGRSVESTEQGRIQTSPSLRDVEIGTHLTQCPTYGGSGLIDSCMSASSSTNYVTAPGIIGGSLLSTGGHFFPRTAIGMRRGMDIGHGFNPSQNLLPTGSHQGVDSDPYKVSRQRHSRLKPYTGLVRQGSRPRSTAMTRGRQQSVSHVVGCNRPGQVIQEDGHLTGFDDPAVAHSNPYSEHHDTTFSVGYEDQSIISHEGSNENYRYPLLHQMTSPDSHVMSYNTPAIPPYPETPVPIPPADGSVWRPYSEPHRLSGFGLSDILPQSGPESNHTLHHHESAHPQSLTVNRIHSFLVNRSLDDI